MFMLRTVAILALASLPLAITGFAKDAKGGKTPCKEPAPPTQVCEDQGPCCPAWASPLLNAGYDYPARMKTRCPADLYVDLDFLYLQTAQDGMAIGLRNSTTGIVTAQIAETNPITACPNGINGKTVSMDFDYHPGFQVAVGGYFDHDDWDLMLQYTWLHGSQTKTTTAGTGQQIFPSWGHPFFEGLNVYNSGHEKWLCLLDIGELNLGRWYYVGKKLTFHPTIGVRTAFIRQNVTAKYINNGALGAGSFDVNTNRFTTRSWGLGPELALTTDWNLGSGFRFYGYGETDLLFTDYTKVSSSVAHTTGTPRFTTSGDSIYTVRSHVDLELGFGWGSYFDCNKWYLDLALGYDFQVFFDQNMLPIYNDDIMIGAEMQPRGNLYLQGLTVRSKLDF